MLAIKYESVLIAKQITNTFCMIKVSGFFSICKIQVFKHNIISRVHDGQLSYTIQLQQEALSLLTPKYGILKMTITPR